MPRGMTREELRAVALEKLREKRPRTRAKMNSVAFDAIRRTDPLSGTTHHPHGVNYSYGIVEVANEAVTEYEREVASRKKTGAYCSICKGPHVYKHGR